MVIVHLESDIFVVVGKMEKKNFPSVCQAKESGIPQLPWTLADTSNIR